jgi:hypothetical protein
VQAQPEQFEALREQYSPELQISKPHAWRAKQGVFGLDRVVEALADGEIAAQVLDAPIGFMIVRRESAARYPVATGTHSFELPEIKPLAPEAMMARYSGEEIAAGFTSFAQGAAEKLALSDRERGDYEALTQTVATTLAAAEPADRIRALASARAEYAALLGPERHATLQALRDDWLLKLQDW